MKSWRTDIRETQIHLTRRDLLQRGSAAALVGMLGRQVPRRNVAPLPRALRDARQSFVDPDLVQSLALRALDVAHAAGASYADVRLTRTLQQTVACDWRDGTGGNSDTELLGFCVRALVKGYWGFVATPYWTPEEGVRIAQAAVAQAKQNAMGPSRPVDLGTYPVVRGSWIMPVRQDPFRISLEEKHDFLWSAGLTAKRRLPSVDQAGNSLVPGVNTSVTCMRQERALATTEGTYITQTVYRTEGTFDINNGYVSAYATGLAPAGRGWELVLDAKLLDQVPALLEDIETQSSLPVKPVEIGRYDVVCDAATMAGVLDATLGAATEVDRALGYEANAHGTSYLGPDPLAELGTAVASPLVTVTANRSLDTGLATVKWDEEGVGPTDFPLVTQGTLVDYQTTREQAAWLAPWYQRHGVPMRSHGCAAAEDASYIAMQMIPNLTLEPSAERADFDDLIAGMSNGIAIVGGYPQTDFQSRNGSIQGVMFQVKNGKRVATFSGGGVLFNSLDLWKNVTAVGGPASIQHLEGTEYKGEPQQSTTHTVSAVPAAIKNMPVFDVSQKV